MISFYISEIPNGMGELKCPITNEVIGESLFTTWKGSNLIGYFDGELEESYVDSFDS